MLKTHDVTTVDRQSNEELTLSVNELCTVGNVSAFSQHNCQLRPVQEG